MTSPQDPAEPQNTNATPAAEAETAKSAAPEQAAAPAERPRPAFGEYAPEGWSWQPPAEADNAIAGQDDAGARTEVPAPQYGAIIPGTATPAAQQTGTAQPAVPPTLAGVPHNLGVGQQRPGTPQAFAAPVSAPAPTSAPGNLGVQAPAGAAGAPAYASAQPAKRRVGDRVVTILLLAAGALGALNFASSFMNLQLLFTPIADAIGIKDWVAPAAVTTIGTVGTFTMLALFAITLILSVQRIRRNKLAFFIPLIGGVVAFIVAVIIMSIAFSMAPEIAAGLTPENFTKVMDALANQAK